MIKIHQTRLGPGNGDCFLACVASVLERPLASVPDFGTENWFEKFYEWCLSQNIGLICLSPEDFTGAIALNLWCILICDVPGADEDHAVVGKCKRIFPDKWEWEAAVEFDPNPMGVKLGTLKHAIFLVPYQSTAISSGRISPS
jgi:hypothetical protein